MKEVDFFFAVERFSQLSNEEITSEIGLGEHIKDITKLLLDSQSLIKDADPSRWSHTVEQLINKIDEVACHIEEYSIEIYGHKRCFSLSSFVSKRVLDTDHASIKNELAELKDQVNFTLAKLRRDLALPSVKDTREKLDYYNRPDRKAVGLTEAKAEVMQHLMDDDGDKESNYLKVISLCGIGGVGKTALMYEVLYDSNIMFEFFAIIWIPVSSKPSTKIVLLHIISEFSGKDYSDRSEDELVNIVISFIKKTGKCLFALDGVWSVEVSEVLQRLLLKAEKRGSRILLTTRKRQIAEYGILDPFVYRVRGLTPEYAWELFMGEYGRHNREDKLGEKEDVGRKMVKQCEGLPVAIIKLAQELAHRKNLDEWSMVHQNLMSFLSDTLLQALGPSFDDMPDELKSCFVYLSLWPEDSVIETEKLYHLWIVEGIVKPPGILTNTLFDVAEQNLIELERMSMVELEGEEFPRVGRRKFCHIPRMMRQLCISKAKQSNFSHIIDSQLASNSSSASSRNKTRRLSLCLERPEDISILSKKEHTRHLRSLHIHDPYIQRARRPVTLSGKFDVDEELKLLRILDFDGVDFGWHKLSADGMSNVGQSRILEGLSKLVHLRYLSFKRCFLDQLPLPISYLLYLQILDLRMNDLITEVAVPNVLWQMRNMKHLYLPRLFRTYNGDKLRLDGLTELETLENFITRECNVSDLHRFNMLHSLTVKVDGDLSDLQAINNHLKQCSDKQIQLSIDVRNFDCFEENRHSVIRELLQYQAVGIFCIEGHIRELPSKHKISHSLTKIVLIGSELEKDPMKKLSELPYLQVLVLDDNAFEGKDMASPASGFTELKHLEILNLIFLESWMVENNAMPKLSNIKIENCKKLRILDGFEFLTALRKVEIAKMSKPFADKLRVITTAKIIDITKSQDEAKALSSALPI